MRNEGYGISSYLDRGHNAVIAHGKISALFADYLQHASTLGKLPDENSLGIMQRTLACACLQLSLLPPDQFCAWTLHFVQPARNVFLAGDNSGFQITGRIFANNVKTQDTNRIYVETQRPKHEPTRSILDFEGQDILSIFELYFERSLQMKARLFAQNQDEYVLVQGLPRVDQTWLSALDIHSVLSLIPTLEKIEKRHYRFFCGCNTQKILMVIRKMFASDPAELFGDQDQVEVQCPRCGRNWIVRRDEFEAKNRDLGFS